MKFIRSNYLIQKLIISLLIVSCKQQIVNYDSLVQKKGLYYYKSDTKPFYGACVGFYADSTKKVEGKLIEGLEEGEWRYWYNTNLIKEIANYKAGKLNGLRTGWCDCGPKTYEINYKNDLPHGLSIHYNSGKKSSEEFYVEGKLHGKAIEWHENGQKKVAGNYVDNEMDGLWIYSDYKGTKVKERLFEKGKLIRETNY